MRRSSAKHSAHRRGQTLGKMPGPLDVLLVEDNEGDVSLVKQSLLECGLVVCLTVARDGQEALRILSNASYVPQLVILDLNLPRVPGLMVLERTQQQDVPFVIFSSSCNSAETKRALQLGARACIQKPSEISAFIAAVCSMVARWARQPI